MKIERVGFLQPFVVTWVSNLFLSTTSGNNMLYVFCYIYVMEILEI